MLWHSLRHRNADALDIIPATRTKRDPLAGTNEDVKRDPPPGKDLTLGGQKGRDEGPARQGRCHEHDALGKATATSAGEPKGTLGKGDPTGDSKTKMAPGKGYPTGSDIVSRASGKDEPTYGAPGKGYPTGNENDGDAHGKGIPRAAE